MHNPKPILAKSINSYRKYWAECLLPTPEMPMTRAELDKLGWDSCDIIVVCGDAYVDHPSFGMAVIGRVLPVPAVATAGTTFLSPSPAKAGASAPHATPGAWPRRRHT